ncbi:hypothetical protein NL108_013724 [Boleophthalmus pectinirostris]|nr:hypothetical protein NL108_013724 [Boleophthalmus pectinirostris]
METDTKGAKNALSSPTKPPQPQKKIKPNDIDILSSSEPPYVATVLAAIKTQSDQIQDVRVLLTDVQKDLKENTLTLTNLTKSVEYNSSQIKDCKEKNRKLESEVIQLKEKNADLEKRAAEVESRMAEAERYKRRWNLRLNGLKEDKGENTRDLVVSLLSKIAPHWKEKMGFILDSVHRVGPHTTNHPRQVIMQFTMRIYRDELWRVTKKQSICKDLSIRFVEDLSKEDREARKAVWPKVEQARREGHKTMCRGPYAYINGQRVVP